MPMTRDDWGVLEELLRKARPEIEKSLADDTPQCRSNCLASIDNTIQMVACERAGGACYGFKDGRR